LFYGGHVANVHDKKITPSQEMSVEVIFSYMQLNPLHNVLVRYSTNNNSAVGLKHLQVNQTSYACLYKVRVTDLKFRFAKIFCMPLTKRNATNRLTKGMSTCAYAMQQKQHNASIIHIAP
jgi:hypothetical protein